MEVGSSSWRLQSMTRRVEPAGQAAGHLGDPDIPGDMPPALSGIEAEIAEGGRNCRGGVIADEQAAAPAAFVMKLEGRRIAGTEESSSHDGCD